MSTTEKLMTRQEAKPIVEDIIERLHPHCMRIEPAGSYKREKTQIGDIEMVCIPKTEYRSYGLFGKEEEIRVDGFINAINQWEKVKGDPVEGKYTQRIHESGMKLDIFIVTHVNWGIQLLMRIGPWEYSKRILGTELKKHGYYSKDGFVHKKFDGSIVPTYEERDVYKLIESPWVEPYTRIC